MRDFFRRWRAWAHAHPVLRWVYKVIVGVIGIVIVVVGLILVPLPGPGWLIVFIGIAILGTEFPAAHRLNAYIKGQLHRFWRWWRARNAPSARDPAAPVPPHVRSARGPFRPRTAGLRCR